MNAKLSKACLIAIAMWSSNSCGVKVVEKPVRVEVPVRCQVPEVKEPEYLIPTEQDSSVELLRKLLHNYAECRSYSDKLKRALEVCK